MAILRVFRDLRAIFADLARSLEGVRMALVLIVEQQRELGPAHDRLAELELSRAKFEAEMEGMVLKAEGKYKAASSAEARERTLRKSYERESDEIDLGGSEPETSEGDPVLHVDAEASEAERLQSLRLDVAPPDGKALALIRKWQR